MINLNPQKDFVSRTMWNSVIYSVDSSLVYSALSAHDSVRNTLWSDVHYFVWNYARNWVWESVRHSVNPSFELIRKNITNVFWYKLYD